MTVETCLKWFDFYSNSGDEDKAIFWMNRAIRKGYVPEEEPEPEKKEVKKNGKKSKR